MKKILYFLCFITLSLHANLDVKFVINKPGATVLNACLTNTHALARHICGSSFVKRTYNDNAKTTQIFYAEVKEGKNYNVKWDKNLPSIKGVTSLDTHKGVSDKRTSGFGYTPKGSNGSVVIVVDSKVEGNTIMLSNILIDDRSS